MVPLNFFGAAAVVATALFAALAGYSFGARSVQAEWDAERAQVAEEQAQQRAEALARERTLQANADRLRKEKTHEQNRIAAVQRELADSLRERADRPSDAGVPTAAGNRDAAPGCTGAELFRPDGEFLAGEAARADAFRLHLAQCQAAYGAARDSTVEPR